ncbi:hypothetical protein [Confluentibacter sediminis]|uniref:hypothetical protein n=1 Tax=Confluentibacter sediminis TaxID=2219045 RepID=UPI000DAE402C|nr:hypothetical protein [Confluentibacter sediminis]
MMTDTVKFWITLFVSIVAIGLSIYTIWDTTYRSKIEISCGKQAKLYVSTLDNKKVQPIIMMSLAFINSGGKTAYLSDVKLNVRITSNNKTYIEQDFNPIREYENILYNDNIIQSEILPIVIIGRTSIVKKYIFYPSTEIKQIQIPSSFDVKIKVLTSQNGNWTNQKEYEMKNVDNVWQDIESTQKLFNSSLRDLYEK